MFGNMPQGMSLNSPTQFVHYQFIGGMGSGDFASQMAAMQQQLMQNPEMVRQMMESPLMQGMMNNPEMLRNIFTSNPQMQQLLEVCVCVCVCVVSQYSNVVEALACNSQDSSGYCFLEQCSRRSVCISQGNKYSTYDQEICNYRFTNMEHLD